MSAATVLIVDDNAPLARSVAELLSRRSFRTVVAGTASAGLRLARRLRPDLVIVDVDLPDVSGRELSRRLARLTPPVPVMAADRVLHPPAAVLMFCRGKARRQMAAARTLCMGMERPRPVAALSSLCPHRMAKALIFCLSPMMTRRLHPSVQS